MSEFSRFMRACKIVKPNEKYPATKSLVDENGKPLLWEFRRISSKENAILQEEVMAAENIKGKSSEYLHRLIARATVFPNLYDKELQDSYGARTPEELLYAMVDDPGEYGELALFIQRLQGLTPISERVDEAKN